MDKRTSITNLISRIEEVGIIGLIALTPIYYGSVGIGSVTAINLAILFMILIWSVKILISKRSAFRSTPLDVMILTFCAYSIVSTLILSRYAHASYVKLLNIICLSGLYFIVVNHVRTSSQILRMYLAIVLVGSALAFIHLMQNATGAYGVSAGTLLNVGNHFAGYMVIIIPLSVAMSFVVTEPGKRVLLIFSSVIMASAMAFSLVAGAMLAFALSLIVIALFYIRSGNTRKQAIILGSIVICLVSIVFWFGHEKVVKELLTVTNLSEGSPAGRLSLWKSSLAMILDNPILGTGLGTFEHIYPTYRLPDLYGRAIYAHNDWLQLITETGLVGLIITLLGMAFFFVTIARSTMAEEHWIRGVKIGGMTSVIIGSVHALVDFNLHIPAIAVLFTIIVALTMTTSVKNILAHDAEDLITEERKFFAVKDYRIPAPVRVLTAIYALMIVGFLAIPTVRIFISELYCREAMNLEAELFWDEAIERYQSAINTYGANGDYFYYLGNVYAKKAKMNNWDPRRQERYRGYASKAYKEAIDLCPMNSDYYLVLGNLHELSKDMSSAESGYLKAIMFDPNNAFYHRIYGNLCLKKGNVQKAIIEYKKALEVCSNDLGRILSECYAICNERAPSTDELTRRQLFLSIAKEIASPDVLGKFCASRGLYDIAISEYQEAIKRTPGQFELYVQLSNLLTMGKKFDESIALWHKFIKSNPQDPRGYSQLASVFEKQVRIDDAIKQYLLAARFERKNSIYLNRAAELYLQQGKLEKASEIWQAVLSKEPYNAGAHFGLGRYYEAQGDWISALSFLQKAITIDPKNVAYRIYLAQSYHKREQLYEAIRELEQVVKIQPKDVNAHLQLARIYQKIEIKDKARKHYQTVSDLQPDNAEARAALLVKE